MTNRRSFLSDILAIAAAPAIVRAGSLMPIYAPKRLWVPGDRTVTSVIYTPLYPKVYLDGVPVHCSAFTVTGGNAITFHGAAFDGCYYIKP